MSQKEFFSGGGECRPPEGEFFPTREEFSRPTEEVIPPAAEQDRSGGEFHQSAGPESTADKKRRRNISPAMLTTAAVVTAAVLITPISSVVKNTGFYPAMQLSAQSKAYLDEVWEVMPEWDGARLLALAKDERLRDLAVDEVTPYLEMLWQDYGLDGSHGDECDFCSNDYALREGFHSHFIGYNGQQLGVSSASVDEGELWLLYERYAEWETPDEINGYVTFEQGTYLDSYDVWEGQRADIYWHSYENDTRRHSDVLYMGGLWELMDLEGHRTLRLKSGVLCNYTEFEDLSGNNSTPYSHREEYVAEGEFATVFAPNESGGFAYRASNYLNNGTITIRQFSSASMDRDYTVSFDVVDGVIRRTDDMSVEYYEESGTYTLYITSLVTSISGDSYLEYVPVHEAESEEALFLTSDWPLAAYIYYFG